MNEIYVEHFTQNNDGINVQLSSLNEYEKEQLKKDIEVRAVSEFYNRKVRLSVKKI